MSPSLQTIYYISAHREYKKRANINDDVISNPDIPITFILKKVKSPYDLFIEISVIDAVPGGVKIVIDYISFAKDKINVNKYSQVVRDAIASYPEYDFYFDITHIENEEDTIASFLFDCAGISDKAKKQISEEVDITVHEFNSKERSQLNAYHQIVMGKSNLFDASNLRWASLEVKYLLQGQTGRNYKQIQNLRIRNLASCVHSDDESAILNCYLLFANGYRTIPVSSAFELRRSRSDVQLVIREWNLLFANEDRISGEKARQAILGYKMSNDQFELVESDYWDWDKNYFFIACEWEKSLNNTAKQIKKINNVVQSLPGTVFPTLNGIYKDLMTVLQRKPISEDPLNLKREDVLINKSVDTQKMIQEMNERASKYYRQEHYVYAAIVSRMALEVNNGFFPTLSAKSIYILALAENAIAVNNLLGDDDLIAEDARIRINYIEKEVRRLLNKSTSDNLIHQILSDCRYYCKEKERFQSEDVFISEMAHINDGGSTAKLLKEGYESLTSLFRKYSER